MIFSLTLTLIFVTDKKNRKMSIPQLDSCFCGCSLKAGSKIIGWISMIVSIYLILIFGLTLYFIQIYPERLSSDTKLIYDNLPALRDVTIMMIILHVTGCIMSLILLIGVYQGRGLRAADVLRSGSWVAHFGAKSVNNLNGCFSNWLLIFKTVCCKISVIYNYALFCVELTLFSILLF
ncbi:uncharacterized protein LOC124357619 isoform X2 [Homalodisca vitripennis]|uniref:uncharacterized protein LOC124357619 isoform X2 n=1 Tax=Homalodisca vitripennis TaxID=197043 RepID=UPI001EE9F09B|nr:uncharacterized protein LOC124357619 isoform X2 [Homalodisca vitripennis]